VELVEQLPERLSLYILITTGSISLLLAAQVASLEIYNRINSRWRTICIAAAVLKTGSK